MAQNTRGHYVILFTCCKNAIHLRLIESTMGLRPRQGNLRLVFRLLSLMRGLRFPCRGLNPIIDYFSHPLYFLKQNIYWILNFILGHSCNLQGTFLFIVLTCVCMHFTWLTVDQKSTVTFPVHHWLSVSYSAWNLHGKYQIEWLKWTWLGYIEQWLADWDSFQSLSWDSRPG